MFIFHAKLFFKYICIPSLSMICTLKLDSRIKHQHNSIYLIFLNSSQVDMICLYGVDCSYFITTTYNVQSEDSFQRVNGSFNVNHMEFNMIVPEQNNLTVNVPVNVNVPKSCAANKNGCSCVAVLLRERFRLRLLTYNPTQKFKHSTK